MAKIKAEDILVTRRIEVDDPEGSHFETEEISLVQWMMEMEMKLNPTPEDEQ